MSAVLKSLRIPALCGWSVDRIAATSDPQSHHHTPPACSSHSSALPAEPEQKHKSSPRLRCYYPKKSQPLQGGENELRVNVLRDWSQCEYDCRARLQSHSVVWCLVSEEGQLALTDSSALLFKQPAASSIRETLAACVCVEWSRWRARALTIKWKILHPCSRPFSADKPQRRLTEWWHFSLTSTEPLIVPPHIYIWGMWGAIHSTY